ncbi:MAG TPA: sialate O-acetylesterase [Steroidobacteraceae bacterium]|jgi:sialate O-acetylesterase|nr:sialate O-acetylesterase [Steroidobacteraceae bacterium]
MHPVTKLCTLACLIVPGVANAALLNPVFQDHAVLQRDKPINVWGDASPSETLSVSLGSQTASAQADERGRWHATLPATSAGGPYELVVRTQSGQDQTVSDVLVGDVWLCSGQSNMVLQVHRSLDSRSEIANSANDAIRMLTVPETSSPRPLDQFMQPVTWKVTSPATVPDFSAACFYFARELRKTVDVPMGLIVSAWGGSRIEPWMSEAALRAAGGNNDALDVLALYAQQPAAAHVRWGAMWEAWWLQRTQGRRESAPWAIKPTGEWRVAPPGLGYWEQWGVPELASYDGMVWYRTTMSLSAQQAQQQAVLSLGRVDEMDQTWINGRPIGSAPAKSQPDTEAIILPGPARAYRLPRDTLKAGENVIVVNVLDTYSLGGLVGPVSLQFADGSTVRLDNEWRYQIPPAGLEEPPRPPWDPTRGKTVLYNAMIAPLGDLSMRGVAWYQGESNTGTSASYEDLLARFMADWRGKFSAELPFLIVQLANYGQPPTAPVESGWAGVREAQRLAVANDAHAGLVIAIDIGERYDIHPPNKQEVGRRLARAARRVAYGEQIAPSGPVALSARKDGTSIVVTFGDVADRLITYSAREPIGFELCTRDANSCRYAKARIEGTRVVLDATALAVATRVRYCWADGPVCTLFDTARLPAGPFQIEVQPW